MSRKASNPSSFFSYEKKALKGFDKFRVEIRERIATRNNFIQDLNALEWPEKVGKIPDPIEA